MRELADEISFRSTPTNPVSKQQVVADELEAIAEEDGPADPNNKADCADACHEDHPEPQEEVNLLVVEVYRQNALDRVRLNVAEVLTPDAEVAEGDAWKGDVAFLCPVVPVDHFADDVYAEGAVLGGEDDVEEEELENDVSNIADLGEDEKENEIVAESKRKTKTEVS